MIKAYIPNTSKIGYPILYQKNKKSCPHFTVELVGSLPNRFICFYYCLRNSYTRIICTMQAHITIYLVYRYSCCLISMFKPTHPISQ